MSFGLAPMTDDGRWLLLPPAPSRPVAFLLGELSVVAVVFLARAATAAILGRKVRVL